MKFKSFYIKFPRKLNDKEEYILIGEIKNSIELWQKDIINLLDKLESNKTVKFISKTSGANNGLDMLKTGILRKEISVYKYVRLGKIDGSNYKLSVAVYDLAAINHKIKIFGRNIDISYGNMIDEKSLIKYLKDTIFPIVGFNPKEIAIETKMEEFE